MGVASFGFKQDMDEASDVSIVDAYQGFEERSRIFESILHIYLHARTLRESWSGGWSECAKK